MADKRLQPLGGFAINIETPKIALRDSETGRFTAALGQLYRQNEELSNTLRYQVARRMQNSLKRPGVSTGRLLRVTNDPKNSARNGAFVGVGNEEFLNRSIAKYWRTVEEGTAATWTKRSFTSLPLQGLWGTNMAGWNTSAGGSEWAGLASRRQRGGRGQEMYHPFRHGRGGGPSPLPVFYPKADTEPMHAYKAVAENPDFNRQLLLQSANFWNHILGRGITPSGFRGGIYDHGIG